MRNLIYYGLFLALVGIGLVGCEESQLLTDDEQKFEIEYKLDNIPSIKYNESQEIQVRNESDPDPDEEKINNQLADLAEATKSLIKDYNFNELIIQIAIESNVDVVYYSDIKENGLSYYNSINENLAMKGLSIESITDNMTHEPTLPNPEYPETAELEIYEPAIFVPNSLIADVGVQPLISSSIVSEIEDEDYILAWYFDEDNTQQETMLNEETAKNTTNPIFIIDHAIPKSQMIKIGNYIEATKDADPLQKTNTYFESNRIKIKNGYRYEGSGKSEFCIGGVLVRDGSPPANFIHVGAGDNDDHSTRIAKVTKNQVNNSSSVYATSYHAGNHTPYSQNKVYWNTFERDWYKSIKDLGHGNTFGQDWYMYGNMTFSGEWYQWIPSTVPIHATPFEWFGWETLIPFTSWKSEYDLIKVN